MIDTNLESIVFSKIKTSVTKKLKNKYPDLNFTTSDKKTSKTAFPNVRIFMLQSSESGSTTEGDDIEGLYASFLIEVYDSESQNRAKEVADAIVLTAKKMRFQFVGFPYNDNTDSSFRTVLRMRRMIGDEDIL